MTEMHDLDVALEATQISPSLFLGGAHDAASWWFIVRRIRHVVNCADASATGLVTMPFVVSSATLDARDADDYPIFERHLNRFLEFMIACRREGGLVLVHCHEGRNRSAALVAAMMILCGEADAVCRLRALRGEGVLNNAGFVSALGYDRLCRIAGPSRVQRLREAWGDEMTGDGV